MALSTPAPSRAETGHHKSPLGVLVIGALGVVFGDIGTSPLYAFKEAFGESYGFVANRENIFAVLSMIFWCVTLVVSVKYVTVVLRFDNNGEGGVLALLTYANRLTRPESRLRWLVGAAGIFAASLFYGDAIITPAISVLSAVEGLTIAAPAVEHWVVPVTMVVLTALFLIQSRGTGAVGRYFGPITTVWFLVLAVLGIRSIVETPEVLLALNPAYGLAFAVDHPVAAFLVLGAVFLTLTGGEALYADMGHFGRLPIRIGWFGLVFPALMCNYFGQGALVLRDPEAAKNPFYLLAPEPLLLPLVVLATLATVIASQATISGAFSITQQASRLGYLPRIPVKHTSDVERGQIYIGRVNWLMLAGVLGLVLAFRSSTNLAAAYGIAVSGTMVLETSLVAIVVFGLGGRLRWLLAVLAIFGTLELFFFASNATKFLEGGWFPVLCGLVVFTILTTWKRANEIIGAGRAVRRVPVQSFFEQLSPDIPRVPGTAVYLSAESETVPTTLLHNLKHNKVLHERIVFLTFSTEDVPRVPDVERAQVQVVKPKAIYQVSMRFGFREDIDVPRALGLLTRNGITFDMQDTTFFLGKSSIAPARRTGLFTWRRAVFRWMQRNSSGAAEYFRLPPDRVIELGTQISI
jgi:KUP system potassium uptake protein